MAMGLLAGWRFGGGGREISVVVILNESCESFNSVPCLTG
jgi:hypothetical protein